MNSKCVFKIRDPVLQAVVEKFQPQFIPRSRLVCLIEGDESLSTFGVDDLADSGLNTTPIYERPNAIFYDAKSRQLVLVDVAAIMGQMTPERCVILRKLFAGCNSQLILINAFADRRDFRANVELPWSSAAWFASEPEHLVQFDGPYLRKC
jgi:hypothetical protein